MRSHHSVHDQASFSQRDDEFSEEIGSGRSYSSRVKKRKPRNSMDAKKLISSFRATREEKDQLLKEIVESNFTSEKMKQI